MKFFVFYAPDPKEKILATFAKNRQNVLFWIWRIKNKKLHNHIENPYIHTAARTTIKCAPAVHLIIRIMVVIRIMGVVGIIGVMDPWIVDLWTMDYGLTDYGPWDYVLWTMYYGVGMAICLSARSFM